jgi:hypothetical protein
VLTCSIVLPPKRSFFCLIQLQQMQSISFSSRRYLRYISLQSGSIYRHRLVIYMCPDSAVFVWSSADNKVGRKPTPSTVNRVNIVSSHLWITSSDWDMRVNESLLVAHLGWYLLIFSQPLQSKYWWYFDINISQWPRGLRYKLSSLARKLGSWVRIPLKTWMSVSCAFILCLCCSVCR